LKNEQILKTLFNSEQTKQLT